MTAVQDTLDCWWPSGSSPPGNTLIRKLYTTIHLRLRDEKGIARPRTLSQLALLGETAHACPGRIILRDRFDKSVEFFTFGGSLEETSGVDEMVFSLRSPAPVLALGAQRETISDLLASETESLMAEAEVRWGRDEEGFNRRLASIDPLQFYLTVLQSILFHYERAQDLENAYHEFYESLLQEKRSFVMEGLWPAKPSTLDDLLAPV